MLSHWFLQLLMKFYVTSEPYKKLHNLDLIRKFLKPPSKKSISNDFLSKFGIYISKKWAEIPKIYILYYNFFIFYFLIQFNNKISRYLSGSLCWKYVMSTFSIHFLVVSFGLPSGQCLNSQELNLHVGSYPKMSQLALIFCNQFFKCAIPGLFFVYFLLLKQTFQFLSNKYLWKMSVQYMVLGFELTTIRTWVSSHYSYTSAPAQILKPIFQIHCSTTLASYGLKISHVTILEL